MLILSQIVDIYEESLDTFEIVLFSDNLYSSFKITSPDEKWKSSFVSLLSSRPQTVSPICSITVTFRVVSVFTSAGGKQIQAEGKYKVSVGLEGREKEKSNCEVGGGFFAECGVPVPSGASDQGNFILSLFYLYFIFILSLFYLYFIFILSLFYLYFIFILSLFYLYFIFILSLFYLYLKKKKNHHLFSYYNSKCCSHSLKHQIKGQNGGSQVCFFFLDFFCPPTATHDFTEFPFSIAVG